MGTTRVQSNRSWSKIWSNTDTYSSMVQISLRNLVLKIMEKKGKLVELKKGPKIVFEETEETCL